MRPARLCIAARYAPRPLLSAPIRVASISITRAPRYRFATVSDRAQMPVSAVRPRVWPVGPKLTKPTNGDKRTRPAASLELVRWNRQLTEVVRKGQLDRAMQLKSEMLASGCAPNQLTYTVLIDGLSRMQHFKQAHALVEEMKERRVEPNSITYNALINGYCRADRVSDALQLLTWMEEHGGDVAPNTVSYATVISSYAKRGDIGSVQKMMKKMQDRGVPANTVTFNSVISACTKNNDLTEAEKWLDDMLKLGCEPTAFTFLPLIGAYANQGNEAKVASYLKEMEKRNVLLTQEVYTTLARAWLKQGLEHKLESMMSDMRQRGVAPSVFLFNSIIEALTAQRRAADAEVQARRMLDEGLAPNQYTYFPIFMCYAAQDDLANAARIFALMESMPGCEPDEGAVLRLATSFVRVGQHTDARLLLDRMHKRGKSTRFAANAYCSIAHAFAAARAPSEAEAVVRDMQSRGCAPTVPVMMALAAAWDGAGDAAKRAEAEDWLKAKGVEIDATQMKAMRDGWAAEKRQHKTASTGGNDSTPSPSSSSSNNSAQKRSVQSQAKTQASTYTGGHRTAQARTAGGSGDQRRR